FLRSMAAKRHWIILLPCILLLAGYFLRELSEFPDRRAGRVAQLVLAALILVTFPWFFYRQHVLNHRAMLAHLPLPGRVLISSATDWLEGGWIATECVRESRPSSYLVRATKLLASANWNGSGYQLLLSKPREISDTLDRLGIAGVITDD